ncbi:MAG: flagellar hook-length control protein FliK, partial [Steroidobacteraceae bacterium]
TAGTGFSAALAQSLAAAPADGGTAPDTSAGKPATESDTTESSEPGKGHSAADPTSSALMLLEQALAGALAGLQAAAAASGAPVAPASSASSADNGALGTTGKAGKAGAAALDALLAQSLAADTKAGVSNPASAASASPGPQTAASTAAAGLTAAAQMSAAPQPASQQGAVSSGMALSSPVGTSAWTDELGAKVTWMASQGIQSASLHLSPEHLGPLQVSISVHDGRASVWFGAAQPDTRTALQQSLPQLRQLFANQGLTLADAGVSREPPRGQTHQSPARSVASVSGIAAVGLGSADTRTSIASGLGLLDTYA